MSAKRYLSMACLASLVIMAGALSGCGSSSSEPNVPAESYPNSDLLVSGSWLASHLSDAGQTIIDIRGTQDYAAGHISGAISVPVSPGGTFDIGAGGDGTNNTDLKPIEEIAGTLGSVGISPSATLILYGKNMDMNVGRMFWMLEYLGATDVRILDGGYDAWTQDGRSTSTTATSAAPTTFTARPVVTRLSTKGDVLAHYQDTERYVVVDSRNATDPTGTMTGMLAPFDAGHIPNAVNVLVGDFTNTNGRTKSYADLQTLLGEKGIHDGQTVIAHCYVGYRSGLEYFYFRLLGYNASNYDGSWAEWIVAPVGPISSFGNLLTPGAWLEANLAATNQAIVDVRAAEPYAAGHIPGAINLPITLGSGLFDQGGEGSSATDLKPISEIADILGAAGVGERTRIIVYGQNIDMLAGRMFWMLEYIGATDVRMLDGGYDKWTADGRSTSTSADALPATTFTPDLVQSRMALKGDVYVHYADTRTYAIVDSRNATDFAAKHIPNAINLLVGDFVNADQTVRSHDELKALLDAKGITQGKAVITHCYVGYRSAQHYFVFRLMGFDVSNYDGSWVEWVADPTMPTAS
jgi:3-mercaptopyruvate sulfurtransferase SseA